MKAATAITFHVEPSTIFQSTPPVKAATIISYSSFDSPFISIHAAREGGDVDGVNANHGDIISIHAAREGGDPHNLFTLQHK